MEAGMINSLTSTDWVVQTLRSDPETRDMVDGRVYLDLINPQTTPQYPYIVVSKAASTPVTNASADIYMLEELIDVDVYDRSSTPELAAQILDQVQATLHQASGETIEGTVIGCVFEGETPLPPSVEERVIYQHKSGTFRIFTQ
jgi:hypothetical protein